MILATGWKNSRRRGLTLVEVLLVLALLVLLASITWPALEQPMANQRLRKAADKVRTDWVRARVEAMSTGETCLFRYAAGEDRYQVETHPAPESVLETPYPDSAAAAQTSDPVDLSAATECRRHTLPEGIVFVEGETLADTRSALYQQSTTAAPAEGEWSDPILFHADGTTSDATLVLANTHNRRIQLTLRGLTGVVTVGDTYVGEEELR